MPRRAWVTFELGFPRRGVYANTPGGRTELGAIVRDGCGVTGLDADDCRARVRDEFFRDTPMPAVRELVLDVDVSDLDPMLLPHLGNPAGLGIWYPALNL